MKDTKQISNHHHHNNQIHHDNNHNNNYHVNNNVTPVSDSTDKKWSTMRPRQKLSYLISNITVEPMVCLYIMPSVFASLATQNLNIEKACKVNLRLSNEVCDALSARNTTGLEYEETTVQQMVAGMQTWKTALQSFFPTILILFMGAWSDRSGLRKPCMMLPIVGEFLTSISLIACTYWFYELPMEVAGLFEALWPSLTGGWFTQIMGTFSYIGDITSVESRTVRVGAVNTFISLGVPVGMALSGILYKQISFYGVFGIAAICYVISFMYGWFFIKESPRSQELRKNLKLQQSKEQSGNSRGICWAIKDFFAPKHVSETFRVAFKEGPRNRRKRVMVLMLIVMVLIGPMHGEMSVMYLFTRYRFKWDEVMFSMFSTYGMVINLIGTLITVGICSHFFKMDDALIGALSCISKILASFVYAFASTTWMIYLAPLVEIINGTSFIMMRSIASKLVPPEELGKVNSLFGVCEAIVPLIYGPMYSSVYRATVNYFPGTFFLVGGGLTIPGVIAFLWLYVQHREDEALGFQYDEEIASDKKDQQEKIKIDDASKDTGIDNVAFESEKL